jgi:hypothetical protein
VIAEVVERALVRAVEGGPHAAVRHLEDPVLRGLEGDGPPGAQLPGARQLRGSRGLMHLREGLQGHDVLQLSGLGIE